MRGRRWELALVAALACGVCLIPGLVAGGVVAAVVAATAGQWALVGVVSVVGALAVMTVRRRRVATSCGCADCG